MNRHPPFEQIVARNGAAVARVCRAVLGPHPDADDVWSETFMAALRAYPDLPGDANYRAWLVTIAHRKALDAIRARRRRPVPQAELPEAHSQIGIPGGGAADLWRAVAALPERQRLAVAHHYLGGLTYAEVAAVVGGTAAAARRAAADGIANLRAHGVGAESRGE